MGNKSCYSNTRRRITNTTTNFFNDLTNPSSSRNQYPTFYAKSSEQNQINYKISTAIDRFFLPYYNIEIVTDHTYTEQECPICFEPFYQKDILARLECLCIYHKKCLDEWGQRKQCCPLHMENIQLNNRKKFDSLTEIKQEGYEQKTDLNNSTKSMN